MLHEAEILGQPGYRFKQNLCFQPTETDDNRNIKSSDTAGCLQFIRGLV